MFDIFKFKSFIWVILAVILSGCGAKGDNPAEQRRSIHAMQKTTLQEVRARYPAADQALKQAAGYGVFALQSNKIMVVGIGNGYGVVHDNRSGKETYMRVAQAGTGLGLGINQSRFLMVFPTAKSLSDFIDHGVMLSADTHASAKYKDKGGATPTRTLSTQPVGESAVSGIHIYPLTDNGLSAQAMLYGYKYWPDDALN
jgi:lipid-binding SYLF domain-containing protein